MARILFVAILAMCLVCMLQASPMPDQAQQPTQQPAQQSDPLTDIDNALKAAVSSAQKGYQAFIDDPTVQKVWEDAAKLVAQGTEAIRQQTEKVLPKTQ